MRQYISVKNFAEYQHYRDRNPPWIKLYTQLLVSYEFSLLKDQSKWHFCALLLLASKMDNKIPADPVWIARQIGASSAVDLQALANAGLIHASNLSATCSTLSASTERETESETERERETDCGASAPALVLIPSERRRAIRRKSDLPPEREAELEKWFLKFYEEWYPRRVNRQDALNAFMKLEPDKDTMLAIADDIEKRLADGTWRKTEQQYIPHPSTYLNGRQWK